MKAVAVLVAVFLLAACGKASTTTGASTADDAGGAKNAPCDLAAIGLGDAARVPAWKAPPACTMPGDLADAPIAITSEADFAARFACAEGTTSGIDFATHQLMLQGRHLSPASTGGEVVDDGHRVTYVTHQRIPCPNDPRPMPMRYVVAYLLPTGATRSFADAVCTVGGQPACN